MQNSIVFLPLGGSNEVGMNLNAYGYGTEENRKWIVVDCGVTFASEQHIPGVEVILPDPEFLTSVKDDIIGIVLTHAHEDHIGALGYLWTKLEAPLYATPFTAELIKDKLREHGLIDKVELNSVPLKGKIELDPFVVEYVTITHSIPEPNGLKITTPLGTIFHTGDWKIDPDPLVGENIDVAALKQMGDDGILAMVCDSTNVFVEGQSGSEGAVRKELIKLVGEQKGKVAIACFASNVARVLSGVEAAKQSGRAVCLLGRSMVRVAGAARKVGIITDTVFVEPEKAATYKDNEILYLCTGSQGEPRAALKRIAQGKHPSLSMGQGDSVIFSSREIPGNERDIYDLINDFMLSGVEVITAHERLIHVSGHPCRDELAQMYSWVRPQIAIPTHGERRHLIEHARLAQSLQIKHTIAPRNGEMVQIAPDGPILVDEVQNGRLYVDGNTIISQDAEILRERSKIGENGVIIIMISLDKKGRLVGGPDIRARGLADKDGEPLSDTLDIIAEIAEKTLDKLPIAERLDEEYCENKIVRAIRKNIFDLIKKKPMVEVVVMVI